MFGFDTTQPSMNRGDVVAIGQFRSTILVNRFFHFDVLVVTFCGRVFLWKHSLKVHIDLQVLGDTEINVCRIHLGTRLLLSSSSDLTHSHSQKTFHHSLQCYNTSPSVFVSSLEAPQSIYLYSSTCP